MSTSWRLEALKMAQKIIRENAFGHKKKKPRLKFKKNSFTYSLTKLWNSLSSQVRLSSAADDFKSKLHECSFLERIL